jgi:hypothetical protein
VRHADSLARALRRGFRATALSAATVDQNALNVALVERRVVWLVGILRISERITEELFADWFPGLRHDRYELSILFEGLIICDFIGFELGIMKREPVGREPEPVAVRCGADEPPVPVCFTTLFLGMSSISWKKKARLSGGLVRSVYGCMGRKGVGAVARTG